MKKPMIVIAAISAFLFMGGCHRAKSPDAVSKEVANAEQKAAGNVADAQKDAYKDVNGAAGKVDDKAKDLNNADVNGDYDVAMQKAEGDRKIALDKCDALGGDAQEKCKDVADADYQATKANLKAMRTSEKQ